MRDGVSRAAAQAWREPVSSLYLGRAVRVKIRFEVPGLRGDGTPKGEYPVARFFIKLPQRFLLVLGIVLTVIFALAWLAIQILADTILFGGGPANEDGPTVVYRRALTVKAGSPATGAAAAGRALARKRGHLWLVTSPHGAAFTCVADGRSEVLWAVNGPGHPVLAVKQRELRFPDSSMITLTWRGGKSAFRA
jgi:hypothetical protein